VEAGVARQTIYTAFGNKDALIARCVRYLSEQKLTAIHAGIANSQTLADKLDVYLHNIVVMSFELMEMAVDPTDIVTASNTAGQAALSASRREQLALVEDIFSPHAQALKRHDETPETIANFVVMTAKAIKSSAKDRRDLERLIASLRRSVLCLCLCLCESLPTPPCKPFDWRVPLTRRPCIRPSSGVCNPLSPYYSHQITPQHLPLW